MFKILQSVVPAFAQAFASVAIAATLALTSSATQAAVSATPYALGALAIAGDSLSFSNNGLFGDFSDKLTFELGATLGLKADFSWKNRSTSSIGGFAAALYRADGTLLANDSAAGANASQFSPTPTNLASGSYYLLRSGTGSRINGGLYNATLVALPLMAPALAPVPELATWLMLVGGLLLMGCRVQARVRADALERGAIRCAP